MSKQTIEPHHVERRSFLVKLAGTAALAGLAFPLLDASEARADVIMKDDPRITVDTITIPGPAANLTGTLVVPSRMPKAKVGGVVVIGENRGLTPQVKDLARRYAAEGFVALAVDYLGPLGGTPDDIILGPALTTKLKPGEAADYIRQAIAYLKSRADVSKVGAAGYSWGGDVLNDLLVAEPGLSAAVVYSGRSPPQLDKVSQIRAPVQAHYGALEEGALKTLPAYEDALRKSGKTYEVYIYSGDRYGFANDTNPYRYDQYNSDVAWDRSMRFFHKYLEG